MRSYALLALTLVASVGMAQSSPVSDQFRGASGLPGSGFGIKADGSLGNGGAISFSTPVAYSLKGGDGVTVFGAVGNKDNSKFFPGRVQANGTALLGYSLPGFNVTFGGMVLNNSLDTSLNIHVSPTSEVFGLRVGFGVQDALGRYSAGLDGRTYYGVVTKELSFLNAYLSVGAGNNHFENGFGSFSFSAIKGVRTYVEYNGELTSFGAAYQLGQATFSAGLVDNKFVTYSVGLKF